MSCEVRSLGLTGIICSVLASFLAGCCLYPKSQIKGIAKTAPPAQTITLVAYGDTRTGPWGLGDNAAQAIHGKVVDDILKNDGSIDGVIFTGDAVMTNFPLWKKAYWKCFLGQTNRFRANGIPFYPSLGNHEVLSPIVPLLKTTAASRTGFLMPQTEIHQDPQRAVVQAYEAGEEPKVGRAQLDSAETIEQVDINSKQGRAVLKHWEQGISKKDSESANKFGQFERHLQKTFYDQPRDARCVSDAKIFREDYLALAKYDYLGPLLQGKSYYAQTLERNGLSVKLIALDTNCLDSEQQQEFFTDELRGFHGPIIVFGHHPPVDYEHPSRWPWDMVPGWNSFKPYLSNPEGKKIALWIFGHVHDYQRRDSSGKSEQSTGPVVLIAGGGGASLDGSPPSFQWQPAAWPDPFHAPAYHQIKLSVKATSIAVEVRGAASQSEKFDVIDSFSIPLKSSTTKRDLGKQESDGNIGLKLPVLDGPSYRVVNRQSTEDSQ